MEKSALKRIMNIDMKLIDSQNLEQMGIYIKFNEEKSGIHSSLKHGKIKNLSRRHLMNQNEKDYIYRLSSFLIEKNEISKFTLYKFHFFQNIGYFIVNIFPENIFPILIGIRNFFKTKRTYG